MDKLFHGDCLELLKELPNNSIDAVICDLPYGTTQCKWDTIIDFDALWSQLHRVGKDTCPFVMFGAQPFTSILIASNIKNFKYQWVWEKSKASNYINSKHQPMRAHEDIAVFYRQKATYNPQMWQSTPYDKGSDTRYTEVYGEQVECHVKSDNGLRYPRSVQYFTTAEHEGKLHPTQKPIKLLEYLVKTHSNENDVILDPTMGSGGTMLAAKKLNRQFIGIEKERKYYDIATKRLNEDLQLVLSV